jgi:hypothetical protein
VSEAVTALDDRLHDARVAQRGAQPGDRHLDRVLVRPGPGHACEQLLPGHDPAGLRRQRGHDRHRPGRQADDRSVDDDGVTPHLEQVTVHG